MLFKKDPALVYLENTNKARKENFGCTIKILLNMTISQTLQVDITEGYSRCRTRTESISYYDLCRVFLINNVYITNLSDIKKNKKFLDTFRQVMVEMNIVA